MLNIIYKSALAFLGLSLSAHGSNNPAPPSAPSPAPSVTRASETPAPSTVNTLPTSDIQTPSFAAPLTTPMVLTSAPTPVDPTVTPNDTPATPPSTLAADDITPQNATTADSNDASSTDTTSITTTASTPNTSPNPTTSPPPLVSSNVNPLPSPFINVVTITAPLAPVVQISKKTYQQIMETPSNPWLDEDVSLDAKSRIDRMRASSPTNPGDIKMKSLYPAWREAIDKYPPWVESMASYPAWTPTAYSVGYKSWNMGTNDTTGLALALAESKYNIGNIDSFNQYIRSLETSGLLPGTQFIRKEDRTGTAALNNVSGQPTIEQYDAAKAENEKNPVVRAYILLQNGVNFWEAPDDLLGKLKGMCCIMAAKAQIAIAKADSMGYNMDSIASAINYAAQAFNNAKEAANIRDQKRLIALYEMIVGGSMETVKIIGLTSYTPGRKKLPIDSRMAALIIDADAKISYFIDIISQSSPNMMKTNQSELLNDLRIAAQELSTMQSIISQPTSSKKTSKN